MATNPASYNPIGVETGPVSGPPPSLSADTKEALLGDSKSGNGQHAPDVGAGEKVGGGEVGKDEEEKQLADKEKDAARLRAE